MFPLMRTLSTTNTQHPSSNPTTKQIPSDAHFINTQHSTPITRQTCSPRCAPHQHLTLNTHHPSNMFPQMRTSSTPNTQHLSSNKHVPPNAHFINTHHSTPTTRQTCPSDAHFINTQHSTPITQQTCSPRCALHQHPTLNTQHPSKAPHTLRDNTLHLSANTTG